MHGAVEGSLQRGYPPEEISSRGAILLESPCTSFQGLVAQPSGTLKLDHMLMQMWEANAPTAPEAVLETGSASSSMQSP